MTTREKGIEILVRFWNYRIAKYLPPGGMKVKAIVIHLTISKQAIITLIALPARGLWVDDALSMMVPESSWPLAQLVVSYIHPRCSQKTFM